MAAGYTLRKGEIKKYFVSESDFWAAINYTFSDSCKKRSTYKFGLIKSIIDNLFSVQKSDRGIDLSYRDIFSKFAENYWGLITRHNLRQIRPDGKSRFTKLEMIFETVKSRSNISDYIEFDSLAAEDRAYIINEVTKQCKQNVLGALYNDFDGLIFGFDLNGTGIWINPVAYEFFLKYKIEIEQMNYYAWAKFMEKINTTEVLSGVFNKLEPSKPRRQDLNIYRKILAEEFECNNCFYCGKKLQHSAHVDHVIQWSYIKGDYIWNFVLACPACNEKKNDKLPSRSILSRVVVRNEEFVHSEDPFVCKELSAYTPDTLWAIWDYAKLSGIRVME